MMCWLCVVFVVGVFGVGAGEGGEWSGSVSVVCVCMYVCMYVCRWVCVFVFTACDLVWC